MVREAFNARPIVFTATLSAVVGILLATSANILYFSSTSVSRQELREDVAGHEAADHERFDRLRADLDSVTEQQIGILQELSANEAVRNELRLLIEDIEERVDRIEIEHEFSRATLRQKP